MLVAYPAHLRTRSILFQIVLIMFFFLIIIKSDEQRSPSMYLQDDIQNTFRGFRCSYCRFIWTGMHQASLNIGGSKGIVVFHSHPEFRLAQDFCLTVLSKNKKKTFTSNKLDSDHPPTSTSPPYPAPPTAHRE